MPGVNELLLNIAERVGAVDAHRLICRDEPLPLLQLPVRLVHEIILKRFAIGL
jgi:hypothetical protein